MPVLAVDEILNPPMLPDIAVILPVIARLPFSSTDNTDVFPLSSDTTLVACGLTINHS